MANTAEHQIKDYFIEEILERGTQMEVLLAADLRLAKQKAAGVAPRDAEVKALQKVALLEQKLHDLGQHEPGCRWCALKAVSGPTPFPERGEK